MDGSATEKLLLGLLKSQDLLARGYETLEQELATNAEFGERAVELLVNPSGEARVRISIGALLRSVLRDAWTTTPTLEPQRTAIRDLLVEGLVLNYASLPLVESISLILADLIAAEGPSTWETPIRELAGWLAVEDDAQNEAALDALCYILAKRDTRAYVFVPHIMPHLFPLFSRAEAAPRLREKVLVLLYLAISSFAWADVSDEAIVAQCFDETYDLWMSFFLSALQTSPKSHIGLKRYILKILTVIFRDLTKYSKKSLGAAVSVVWKFLNQNLPLYVWLVVYDIPIDFVDEGLRLLDESLVGKGRLAGRVAPKKLNVETFGFELDEDHDSDNEIELIAMQLIELIATLLGKPILRDIVRVGVYPLVNAFCHYMLMTSGDEYHWLREPNQFITNDEDESSMRSIRTAGLKVVSELIDKYPDETLPALMPIIDKFLQGLDEETTLTHARALTEELAANASKRRSASGFSLDQEFLTEVSRTSTFNLESEVHLLKKREAGLTILGSFSEDIIVFQARSNENFDLTKLVEVIVKDLQVGGAAPAVLRGRALWCIGRFSEVISLKHKEAFLPLFALAVNNLNGNESLPIRLAACKSVANFAHKIEKFALLSETSAKQEYKIARTDTVNELFDLLERVSIDTLHLPLEAILHVGRLNRDHLGQIAQVGGQAFIRLYERYATEPVVGPGLKDIIKLLCETQESFSLTYQKFAGFLRSFFAQIGAAIDSQSLSKLLTRPIGQEGSQQTYLEFLLGVLDMISMFLKASSELQSQDNLTEAIPIIQRLILSCDDTMIQVRATLCLKNFILYKPHEVSRLKLSGEIMKIITYLLQPLTNETVALYAGNLIMLTTAFLLGNNNDISLLKAVVSKVYKSKMPSIIQGLALVFARLINVNAKETLNFLTSFSVENRIALKVLIDKWLLHQPLFRGKYTKNATFLALTRLFLLKDKRVETLLVIGYNPSHSNVGSEVCAPFKILSILIRCLDNELSRFSKDHRGDDIINKYVQDNEFVGEDEGEYEDEEGGQLFDEEEKLQVDLNVIKDEDDVDDIEKRFNVSLHFAFI
eukprot:TRINITY_DN3852_c0_g2_i2.p1 TRINITY_DN3852_c0_g2~~TRINITY_DN3852_c0_g2_i2.p1  ORF type:complete len:1056 (-),score=282.50 TRINITY_DN3852_c0_g2_i2:43-3210(-)